MLPALVEHVETKYARLAELLAAGAAAEPGQTVTVDGRAYQRVFTDADQRGLTPLFHTNMTPYGEVRLRPDRRLNLSSPSPADSDGQ